MRLSLPRLLCVLLVLAFSLNLNAFPVSSHLPIEEELTQEQQEMRTELEAKVSKLSDKQKAKLDKKLSKIQQKIDKRQAKRAKKGKKSFDQVKANSGVGTGLLIVLVGVLLAVLGFAGVADILVTIGLVVLVIGLILWLVAQF